MTPTETRTATDLADVLMGPDSDWHDGIETFINASLGESPDDAHATVLITLTDDDDQTIAAYRVTIERTTP